MTWTNEPLPMPDLPGELPPKVAAHLRAMGMGGPALDNWVLRGTHCIIQIVSRPTYCDRGNWLAYLEADHTLNIDRADGWPRYYFDLDRAKAECEAWIQKRGQALPRETSPTSQTKSQT